MSHATVVCVTTNPEETRDDLAFCEEDLFDVPGAAFDYARDLDEEEYLERVNDFLERMERAGAKVDREAQSFTVTDEVVRRYFAASYERLRDLVNRLTFEDFTYGWRNDSTASKDEPPPPTVWDIQNALEDEYDDGVCENGTYRSLDSFMRHAACEVRHHNAPVTYCIRGAVDVHH